MMCAASAALGLGTGCEPAPSGSPEGSPSDTALVYGDIFLRHDAGPGHPESASRLRAIMDKLERSSLLKQLIVVEPRRAPLEFVTAIHSDRYVEEIRRAAAECGDEVRYLDSPDSPISRESYDVALFAAGAVLTAIDLVMEGRAANAFCAVRPPGHHARRDQAKGFCIFNNIAIGAKYLLDRHGLERVAIVDWDVHHGNGTQDAFYEDPRVFYISLHQYPFYPGSGTADERGAGKGQGLNLNIPLPAGSGDEEQLRAFHDEILPALRQFKPEFILISAGFDSHADDPLAWLQVSTEGFAEMTRLVKDLAEELCRGRIVSVLEGGYDHQALAASVYKHLKVLMEESAQN